MCIRDRFKVDEFGQTLEIFVKERKEAHLLIEDFMLLANREVATPVSYTHLDVYKRQQGFWLSIPSLNLA